MRGAIDGRKQFRQGSAIGKSSSIVFNYIQVGCQSAAELLVTRALPCLEVIAVLHRLLPEKVCPCSTHVYCPEVAGGKIED